jgi:hypothetical protein
MIMCTSNIKEYINTEDSEQFKNIIYEEVQSNDYDEYTE